METTNMKATACRAEHKDSGEATAARLTREAALHRWRSERFRDAIEGQLWVFKKSTNTLFTS